LPPLKDKVLAPEDSRAGSIVRYGPLCHVK
jgi:hypothetical protein